MKTHPLILFTAAIFLSWTARGEEAPLRRRINFDADWRFQKNDPPGEGEQLSYPKIREELLTTSARSFVLATGALPVATAPSDLGKEVEYTRQDFDDSRWRSLDLPHDWGIEGPFKREYRSDTGKLPYWGVGWYRKHFDVPAADAGRQYHLDIDGAIPHGQPQQATTVAIF